MRSVLLSCLAIVCLAASAHAQAIVLVCNSDPGVWGRGDCALARGRHGQWVRGSARLAASGRVDVKMGLETDSTAFGIGGKITFDLLDASGKVLASGSTSEAEIPGKSPGKARIWESDWKGTATPIPASMVPQVKSIRVNAVVLDDNAPLPLGIGSWSVSFTSHF